VPKAGFDGNRQTLRHDDGFFNHIRRANELELRDDVAHVGVAGIGHVEITGLYLAHHGFEVASFDPGNSFSVMVPVDDSSSFRLISRKPL